MIAALQTNVSNGSACSCSCSNSRDTLCLRFHTWNDWIVNESMYSNQALQAWKGEGEETEKKKLRKMLVTWILGLLFAGGYWANCHNKGRLWWWSLKETGGTFGCLSLRFSLLNQVFEEKKRSYRVYLKICNSIHEGKPKASIDWYQPPTPKQTKKTHGFLLIEFFHLTPFKVPLALASQIW